MSLDIIEQLPLSCSLQTAFLGDNFLWLNWWKFIIGSSLSSLPFSSEICFLILNRCCWMIILLSKINQDKAGITILFYLFIFYCNIRRNQKMFAWQWGKPMKNWHSIIVEFTLLSLLDNTEIINWKFCCTFTHSHHNINFRVRNRRNI